VACGALAAALSRNRTLLEIALNGCKKVGGHAVVDDVAARESLFTSLGASSSLSSVDVSRSAGGRDVLALLTALLKAVNSGGGGGGGGADAGDGSGGGCCGTAGGSVVDAGSSGGVGSNLSTLRLSMCSLFPKAVKTLARLLSGRHKGAATWSLVSVAALDSRFLFISFLWTASVDANARLWFIPCRISTLFRVARQRMHNSKLVTLIFYSAIRYNIAMHVRLSWICALVSWATTASILSLKR
jgi:hypothetical protein